MIEFVAPCTRAKRGESRRALLGFEHSTERIARARAAEMADSEVNRAGIKQHFGSAVREDVMSEGRQDL